VVEAGRRLDDPPLPGAENMGRDQALLECRLQPTLRFYRWLRPTLSLGYFQAAADLPLDELRARGCDLLRRTTGGKAILHEFELTYALCLPEVGVMSGGPAACMELIHQAFAKELIHQAFAKELQQPAAVGIDSPRQAEAVVELRQGQDLLSDIPGSAWCFEDSSPLDLVVGKRKLMGSAARRHKGWILFHGSLVLVAPNETPGIAALGGPPDQDQLAAALGKQLGYAFEVGPWQAPELQAATQARLRFENHDFLMCR
jgi:lipoyl(octanoyl) transferase